MQDPLLQGSDHDDDLNRKRPEQAPGSEVPPPEDTGDPGTPEDQRDSSAEELAPPPPEWFESEPADPGLPRPPVRPPRPPAAGTTADLYRTPPHEPEVLIAPVLRAGRNIILFGRAGAGKSLLAWYLAGKLTLGGGDILGFPVVGGPRRVGIVLGENDQWELYDTTKAQF